MEKGVKQDVKIQLFVTERMDNDIDDLSEIMGLRKNEVIRMAIANYIAAYKGGMKLAYNFVNEHPEIITKATTVPEE